MDFFVYLTQKSLTRESLVNELMGKYMSSESSQYEIKSYISCGAFGYVFKVFDHTEREESKKCVNSSKLQSFK